MSSDAVWRGRDAFTTQLSRPRTRGFLTKPLQPLPQPVDHVRGLPGRCCQANLLGGLQPHDRAIRRIDEEIEEATGALADVADAAERALEHPLLLHHLLAVEFQADEQLVAQCADEEIAPPGREMVAGG